MSHTANWPEHVTRGQDVEMSVTIRDKVTKDPINTTGWDIREEWRAAPNKTLLLTVAWTASDAAAGEWSRSYTVPNDMPPHAHADVWATIDGNDTPLATGAKRISERITEDS